MDFFNFNLDNKLDLIQRFCFEFIKTLRRPFILTGLFLFLTIFLGFYQLYFDEVSSLLLTALVISTLSLFVIALLFLFYNIKYFNGKSLKEMVFLYLESIVLFGCSYFLLSYFGDKDEHFDGFVKFYPDIELYDPSVVLYGLVESLYFSLVNVSTVGFGNVHPKSYLAMGLASIQTLLGIYTIVVGVSSAFNKKMKDEEERKNIPLLLAAYEDISVLLCEVMEIYQDIYKSSKKTDKPSSIEDFFGESYIGELYKSFDLNSKHPRLETNDFWDFLCIKSNSALAYGNNVLSRHPGHVDPEIYHHVHNFVTSDCLKQFSYLNTLKQLDIRVEFMSSLSKNVKIPDQDFIFSLVFIYNWCLHVYEKFSQDHRIRDTFRYENL